MFVIYCKLLLVLCRERLQVGFPNQVPDAARSCYGYRVRHVCMHVPLLGIAGSYREETPLSLDNTHCVNVSLTEKSTN